MNLLSRMLNRFDLPLMMLFMVALVLSACEMKGPSQLNASPIQVTQENTSNMMLVSSFTNATAQSIGDDYERRGHGPVDVVVTYATGGSEGRAENDSRRIASLLRSNGVEDLTVSTLPVNDPEQAGKVMINYIQVSASASPNCTPHPADTRTGIRNNEDGRYPDYNFGCGIDS